MAHKQTCAQDTATVHTVQTSRKKSACETPFIAAVVEIHIRTYTKSIRRYEAGMWRTSKYRVEGHK